MRIPKISKLLRIQRSVPFPATYTSPAEQTPSLRHVFSIYRVVVAKSSWVSAEARTQSLSAALICTRSHALAGGRIRTLGPYSVRLSAQLSLCFYLLLCGSPAFIRHAGADAASFDASLCRANANPILARLTYIVPSNCSHVEVSKLRQGSPYLLVRCPEVRSSFPPSVLSERCIAQLTSCMLHRGSSSQRGQHVSSQLMGLSLMGLSSSRSTAPRSRSCRSSDLERVFKATGLLPSCALSHGWARSTRFASQNSIRSFGFRRIYLR